MLKYILAQIQSAVDPQSLLCAEPAADTSDESTADFLMRDLEWFCCSFVLRPHEETKDHDMEQSAFEDQSMCTKPQKSLSEDMMA